MKRFIYVAGVDYEFKGGVDFREYADHRMRRRIISNKAKEDLAFIIFDVFRGKIVTNDVTYPGGKKTEKAGKKGSFTAISRRDYDRIGTGEHAHNRFKRGLTGKMSILDVYAAVQEIGMTDPGTLLELSFFSHAWHSGPVLVNSYEGSIVGLGSARDPEDMDPRPAKDFIAPTMDPTELDDFVKAFASDSIIWVWGCTFPRVVHEILVNLERNPKYKPSGLDPDEVLTFTKFRANHIAFLEQTLSRALGMAPFPNKKKIELKFKVLKYFFCRMTTATYMHRIAGVTKITTFGAVVGTYADYDKGVPLGLMSVIKGLAPHRVFYKNYLNFTFDPEGRRYGAYLPDFKCTAPTP